MCETGEAGEASDFSVSCYTADREGEWEKLFTTGALHIRVFSKSENSFLNILHRQVPSGLS